LSCFHLQGEKVINKKSINNISHYPIYKEYIISGITFPPVHLIIIFIILFPEFNFLSLSEKLYITSVTYLSYIGGIIIYTTLLILFGEKV